MRQPLLDAVRGLDPAAGAPPIDGEAMLARIRRQAQGAEVADVAHLLPPRRSRPARRLAMGAAAFAVISVIALVLTLTQRGPQAYASWVPVPTETATISEATQRCPQVEPGSPDVPVEPVLAEQRGAYTFVVLSGSGVFVECLVSDAGGEEFAMAQGTTPADPGALELGQAPVLVLDPGGTWGFEAGEGPITTVVGLADPEILSIEVTTTDGTTAQASITDGWWSVWFPGEVRIADDLVVTTADGERTYSLDGLIAPGLG